MSTDALVDALGRLGVLRPDAVRVYVRSLAGPILSKDLDREFGVGRTRVIRRELTRFGLILERRTPDGLSLFALPPEQAWTAREADFTWAAATSLAPIHDLADTGAPTVDEARRLCREILELASGKYVEVDLLPVARRTALHTSASIAAGLSLLIHAARHEVRAMSRRPHLPQLSTVWEAINHRLLTQPSFQYTRLVEVGTLIEDGLAIVRRDVIETGVGLRVADSERVGATFYLADDRAVLQQDGLDEASIHTDKRRVNSSIARFEDVVDDSLPGVEVARALQAQADGLLNSARASGLGERHTWWLCRRINYGRFAETPEDWPPGALRAIERELLTTGLMTDAGHTAGFPRYDVRFDVLREAVAGDEPLEPDWCAACWCASTMCDCS